MPFLKNIPGESHNEAELLLRYKNTGDLAVLGRLYEPYMDLVYGVCLKYFKDPERSKDAVMQIFEELISKLRRHEVENFRGWLHQLTKNHCLMQLRTPKNLKTVELHELVMQSDENLHLNGVMEKEENFERLQDCLSRLPHEQKKAVELFYMEGKCYNEIVELMDQEWNQVRSFIQNGRRNLKLCMERGSESGVKNREL